MKNMRLSKIIAFILIVLFAGIMSVKADNSLPGNITSSDLRQVTYITAPTSSGELKKMPIYVKQMKDGSYAFCMSLDSTYKAGVTWAKSDKVAPGYIYILQHSPNTGDPDKDYYIMQMAVWYYTDMLNNTDFNLGERYKQYIITQAKKDPRQEQDPIQMQNIQVCAEIIKLFKGARDYTVPVSSIKLDGGEKITFTEIDNYYVSSEIKVITKNLSGKLTYKLTQVPETAKLIQGSSADTLQVKIPVADVKEGVEVNPKITVTGPYIEYTAFSYYASSAYQRLLYATPLQETKTLTAGITMSLVPTKEHPVYVSKTDITQAKEVAGATLVIKDLKGNEIAKWVSTNETKTIKLKAGEYSLTETIAPVGYKLSSTTIYFKVTEDNKIYVKDASGNYVTVDKIKFINELEKKQVPISKTDVTQSSEIPGATLVVKDSNGKEIESWVSTNESHKIYLTAGEYSLTETLAPTGYKLSRTTIYFKISLDGKIYVKNGEGKYIIVDRVVMINELKDVATIAKKDSTTGAYVAGATLVIKDLNGNVIKEYVTGTDVTRVTLDAGEYTLQETVAPNGYELSKEVIYFSILEDGTLRVKNSNGEYSDTAIITFYNNPEVEVPPTAKSSTLMIIGGIALLITGIGYARKTSKEY